MRRYLSDSHLSRYSVILFSALVPASGSPQRSYLLALRSQGFIFYMFNGLSAFAIFATPPWFIFNEGVGGFEPPIPCGSSYPYPKYGDQLRSVKNGNLVASDKSVFKAHCPKPYAYALTGLLRSGNRTRNHHRDGYQVVT